jgi:hypothetical protein
VTNARRAGTGDADPLEVVGSGELHSNTKTAIDAQAIRGPIIGIDPGLVGAWAILTEAGAIVAAGDLPVVGDGARRALSAPLLAAIISRYRPATAVVERVGAFPGQGVSSTFKFGHAAGLIEGVLGAIAVPVMHVAPAVWKRHHRLGAEKESARLRAIEIWPAKAAELFARKRDHGRAEAALIALWGTRAAILSSNPNGDQ